MTEIIKIDVQQSPSNILQSDWDEAILLALYTDTPNLGQELNQKIQARTPVFMGNLVASEKFVPNTDPTAGPDLVNFFAADQEQLDELGRGRIYVQYVEGLEQSNHPISMQHMYGLAETDDTGDIEAWAYGAIQNGINNITSGVP